MLNPVGCGSVIGEDVQSKSHEYFCTANQNNNYIFVSPRKKFKSANEVYLHACAVHCPDNIEPSADIYCQWGPGPGLCDNLPRKRFSLMTHIFDRHCMPDVCYIH